MLRRLALTATASVAALAAAVPASASASPVPLPLSLPLLSAPQKPAPQKPAPQKPAPHKSAPHKSAPQKPAPHKSAPHKLTVTVSESGRARTDGRYELECGQPASGTHPSAQAACDRLEQLVREGKDPFSPVPGDQMCTQQSGGPATARIAGTWQGRQVDAAFSRQNGCEISRWQTMEPVLPNTRS